ncbi:hypothetical protein MPTK2_2g90050P [Marchantia polymorpha subsp. ruderalis]
MEATVIEKMRIVMARAVDLVEEMKMVGMQETGIGKGTEMIDTGMTIGPEKILMGTVTETTSMVVIEIELRMTEVTEAKVEIEVITTGMGMKVRPQVMIKIARGTTKKKIAILPGLEEATEPIGVIHQNTRAKSGTLVASPHQ